MARNVPVYIRATLEEVKAMRAAQKRGKFRKLGDWCLSVLRQRLQGEAGHVDPGEPESRLDLTHETPSIPLRSWADLKDAAQRSTEAARWIKDVPLPDGFSGWEAKGKIGWLDKNWPLEG